AICESSLVILFVVNLLYLKGEHLALFIFNIQFTPLYGHNPKPAIFRIEYFQIIQNRYLLPIMHAPATISQITHFPVKKKIPPNLSGGIVTCYCSLRSQWQLISY
ncbi:hypothetical protein, partial [Blautia sp. MSJ-19]|uniref:hypothetical protein n=1 Tax=Blautia sp. MSJ-19 TaxID=2841517 RepID=UPI001C0E9118